VKWGASRAPAEQQGRPCGGRQGGGLAWEERRHARGGGGHDRGARCMEQRLKGRHGHNSRQGATSTPGREGQQGVRAVVRAHRTARPHHTRAHLVPGSKAGQCTSSPPSGPGGWQIRARGAPAAVPGSATPSAARRAPGWPPARPRAARLQQSHAGSKWVGARQGGGGGGGRGAREGGCCDAPRPHDCPPRKPFLPPESHPYPKAVTPLKHSHKSFMTIPGTSTMPRSTACCTRCNRTFSLDVRTCAAPAGKNR